MTPWTAAHQASLSITNSRSLLKLMSIKLVMPSNRLILCCSLLLPPAVFPRGLRNFLCSPVSLLPSCRAGWGPQRHTWGVVALCRILPPPPHPWRFRSQWPGLYVASVYISDTRADMTFSGATNKSQTGVFRSDLARWAKFTPAPDRIPCLPLVSQEPPGS